MTCWPSGRFRTPSWFVWQHKDKNFMSNCRGVTLHEIDYRSRTIHRLVVANMYQISMLNTGTRVLYCDVSDATLRTASETRGTSMRAACSINRNRRLRAHVVDQSQTCAISCQHTAPHVLARASLTTIVAHSVLNSVSF